MYPVAIITLGCKLNQFESEAIADSFKQAGFSVAQETALPEPGIIIINTCTVTTKADQKCRRIIRAALRSNSGSCVIVTGCYAQLDPAAISSLATELISKDADMRRLWVLGGSQKSNLLELPEYLKKRIINREPSRTKDYCTQQHTAGTFRGVSVGHGTIDGESIAGILESWMQENRAENVFNFKPETFTFHSRGYLKIQDGCDHHCTYCRVRLARGRSISLPPEAVLERLRFYEERGLHELMISGVNITQYQHSGFNLATLLEYLLKESRRIALRLSSLEPEQINDPLIKALAHPRIRPHFHLSVQSGSDTVLKRMGRTYNAQTVEQGAALLRSVKDNPFLAGDIIAGFPGEEINEFNETLSLCEKIGFAWIHAFPFSKRPGTAAFTMTNNVPDHAITQRVAALNQRAVQGRRRYTQAWLGRTLSAIVEKGGHHRPAEAHPQGHCRAVGENYLKLLLNCSGECPPPGTEIRCRLESLCVESQGEGPDALAVYTVG